MILWAVRVLKFEGIQTTKKCALNSAQKKVDRLSSAKTDFH